MCIQLYSIVTAPGADVVIRLRVVDIPWDVATTDDHETWADETWVSAVPLHCRWCAPRCPSWSQCVVVTRLHCQHDIKTCSMVCVHTRQQSKTHNSYTLSTTVAGGSCLTKSLATAETARVVPRKPYIGKNQTHWVTFSDSKFHAIGFEICRFLWNNA